MSSTSETPTDDFGYRSTASVSLSTPADVYHARRTSWDLVRTSGVRGTDGRVLVIHSEGVDELRDESTGLPTPLVERTVRTLSKRRKIKRVVSFETRILRNHWLWFTRSWKVLRSSIHAVNSDPLETTYWRTNRSVFRLLFHRHTHTPISVNVSYVFPLSL